MSTTSILFPALITASAAFIAGIIAQILSHGFTIKRENDKYRREIYQNLYAPILLDVYMYFDLKTFFKKDPTIPDPNEKKLMDDILNHIEKNIKYASPELISIYQSVKKYEILHDNLGSKDINVGLLLFIYLNDLYKINQKTKLFTSGIKRKLVQNQVYYGLWALIASSKGSSSIANKYLQFKFYFIDKKVTPSVIRRIKKYLYMEKFDFEKYEKFAISQYKSLISEEDRKNIPFLHNQPAGGL